MKIPHSLCRWMLIYMCPETKISSWCVHRPHSNQRFGFTGCWLEILYLHIHYIVCRVSGVPPAKTNLLRIFAHPKPIDVLLTKCLQMYSISFYTHARTCTHARMHTNMALSSYVFVTPFIYIVLMAKYTYTYTPINPILHSENLIKSFHLKMTVLGFAGLLLNLSFHFS